MQDGEGIDLLHDVADMHRSGWCPAPLHLAAQGAQVIGGDFVEQAVLEGWQDVPIDDALAHRSRAVGHPSASQPLGGHVAEVLGGGQAALLALLLVRRRLALGDGLLGIQQLFAGHRERNARRPVAANGQGLAAAVETVIEAEGDGTGGRYRHIHSIPVRSLISQGLRLQIAQCGVGKHRGFSSCS